MTLFGTISPHTRIHGSITPLTVSLARHTPHDPLTLVLPALLLTDEHPLASLIAIDVQTVIQVSIRKLPNTVTVRDIVLEVTIIELALRQGILSETLHLTIAPITLVRLLEEAIVTRLQLTIIILLQRGNLLPNVHNLCSKVIRGPDHFALAMRLPF